MTSKSSKAIACAAFVVLICMVFLWWSKRPSEPINPDEIKVETTLFDPPIIVTSQGFPSNATMSDEIRVGLNLQKKFLAVLDWKSASLLFTADSAEALKRSKMPEKFDATRAKHPPETLVSTFYSCLKITRGRDQALFFHYAPYLVPSGENPKFTVVDCLTQENGTWKFNKGLELTALWLMLSYLPPSKLAESEKAIQSKAFEIKKW